MAPPRTLLLAAAAAAALVALAPSPARAEAPPPAHARNNGYEGTVVAIDGDDLVVDLGAARGVRDGELVELWRPLRIRHPVTGQMLVDRFRIGTLRLVQVQSALSLARLDGEAQKAPAAGDVVVVPAAARPLEPQPPPAGAAPAPLPAPNARHAAETRPAPAEPTRADAAPRIVPADPDAAALSDLMIALEGAAPDARRQAYAAFVASHPRSRFAKVLKEEIAALDAGAKNEPPYKVSAQPIDRLKPGVAQRYAVELDPRFVGALVHVRKKGAPAYRTIPMQSVGARYWAATLPGDAIEDPGVEYFVEGVSADGPAVPVVGTAQEPRAADVDARPTTGKQPGTLAQMMVASEIASFNAKKANDWLWQTEGAVGWRLSDVGMRAVRSGFGVLRGKGGSLHDLDDLGKDPTSIGLTYGYVEVELAPSTSYAFIGRPILGLRDDGITGGAQGFVRVGNDLRTNLVVGGEVLGGVGLRGIVELDWRTIPRVPVVFRTEVTNQPAGSGGDVGARAIAQVGYELVKDFAVYGRGSYQGRTINHAGPGAGLAMSYQW